MPIQLGHLGKDRNRCIPSFFLRCRNLPEFQAAFADALKQKGPTWIECIIDKDEKVLPMIPGGGDINDIIME